MPEPFPVPIGLRLSQVARAVARAFDEALAAAGGTLPVWLVLLNLKIRKPGTQRQLAEAVGITEATLTHHLNAMEADGLIARTRDAANRRVQVVTLTGRGDEVFLTLRAAAIAFDERLRAGFADGELDALDGQLARLAVNAGSPPAGDGPFGDGAGSGDGPPFGDGAGSGDGPPFGDGAGSGDGPPWAGLAGQH